MSHVQTAIVATKTLTLVLGGLITYFAFKAYRRTDSVALRALAIGFGIITVGSIVAGSADVVLGVRLGFSVLLQSVLTLIGFVIITYSLYVTE